MISVDMMKTDNIAIRVSNLSKCYQIYDTPRDRLKQFVVPTLCRVFPPLRKFFSSSTLNPQSFTQHLVAQPLSCVGKTPAVSILAPVFYKEFWALKDVSFEIKKGETVGIIGRNGSGKSTLLQMICGTLTPTGGSIETNGRIAALLELGSGFNPEFTGRENVYMNASVLGLSKEEIDVRFDDIVAFADIGDFIEQPVKTYSSGMLVRLAFAVIVHVDADILVIDEALAVGDIFFTQKCMRFLRKFRENGTILFVSHDTSAVVNLCSRVFWLDCGAISMTGGAKEVSEAYLAHSYSVQRTDMPKPGILQTEKSIPIVRKDSRLKQMHQQLIRNDIQVFEFERSDKRSFGDNNARIISAVIVDANDEPLSWVVGGENVKVVVIAQVLADMQSAIVGFFVKDRLGQAIFGDNTYLSYASDPVSAVAGSELKAAFEFAMPILPRGAYTVDVAIADGSHSEHTQSDWIHDAIMLESHSSSVSTGLVGIPFHAISLNILS